MSDGNHIIQCVGMPVGIWVDAHGLKVNIGIPDARNFIKAVAHQIALLEGTHMMTDPVVIGVHPGIKAFLDDVGKPK